MTAPEAAPQAPGTIITFYSYKGGTGRTMALANVGVLLAQRQARLQGKGVLLVDWDLEAPGLHRFFRDRIRVKAANDPAGIDIGSRPGLIDLFSELRAVAMALPAGQQEPDDESEQRLRAALDLSRFVLEVDVGSLHLLKAGRFGEDYPKLVNTFAWEALYDHAPWVIPWFAGWLAEHYAYVLIDSRTGVTDTSGICTTLLPEKLVVVFTPNFQSTEGALEQIEKATAYRRRSDDLRPLLVYPLPSRIESQLPKLKERWRFDTGFGYQPRFEALFERIYGLERCDLTDYFNDVQVPQLPDYAFGESIAVLLERGADKYSLTSSYVDFVERLLGEAEPWESLVAAENRSATQEALRRADAALARLSPADVEEARRVLGRMVRLASTPEETDSAKRVNRGDLDETAGGVADTLVKAGLLRFSPGEGAQFLELADPVLVGQWAPLAEWIASRRDFLLWRQRLDDRLAQWEETGRQPNLLLEEGFLANAPPLDRRRDLSPAERAYIVESETHGAAARASSRRRRHYAAAAGICLLVVFAVVLWRWWPRAEVPYEVFEVVTFRDRTAGFLAGWSTESSPDSHFLFTTHDAGRTWTSRPLPGASIPSRIYFFDSQHGWIVAGRTVSATSDGGKSWLSRDLLSDLGVPFDLERVKNTFSIYSLESIQFVNANVGWLGGTNGLLLRTEDGGRTWVRKTTPQAFSVAAMHFVDATTGWLVGEYGITATTTDGGVSWKMGRIGSDDLEAVFFLDRQRGWAAGSAGVFRTNDGGRFWSLEGATENTFVESLFFLDDGRGWTAGSQGIYATADGLVWTKQVGGPRFVAIWFVDEDVGWAAGSDSVGLETKGRLFATADGGRSWTDVTARLPARPAEKHQ